MCSSADPDARICGVVAPSSSSRAVDGGLVVTGQWGFASGCLHSQWAMLGVPVVDESGEQIDQGLALIPMSDLSIKDTWYVAGMRGTGSNTLIAEDVFVPVPPHPVGDQGDRRAVRHRAHRRGPVPLRLRAGAVPGPGRPAAGPGEGRARRS